MIAGLFGDSRVSGLATGRGAADHDTALHHRGPDAEDGAATAQAADAGLTGLLVAPGPDLICFTGYQPVAITERITMLVLRGSHDPAMMVPVLERPDAEGVPGAAALALTDWADGSDPYAATAGLLDPQGRYAISDSAWRCTCSVSSRPCRTPGTCR